MLPKSTELTKRLRIVDSHHHRWWDWHIVLWVRHEARIQTAWHFHTRLLEGGLCDGMVFRFEIELDIVARLRINTGRVKCQYWRAILEIAHSYLCWNQSTLADVSIRSLT